MRFTFSGFHAMGGPSLFYVSDATGDQRPGGPRIPVEPAWPVDSGLRFLGGEVMGVLVEQDPRSGNQVLMGALPKK